MLVEDGDVIWSVLLFILLLLILMIIKNKYHDRSYNLPPGPPALPIIGNLIEIENEKKVYLLVTKWAQKYGDVFQIFTGRKRVVVLNSVDAVLDAFVKKQLDYADRTQNVSNKMQSGGYKDVIFAPYSKTWKTHRNLVNLALKEFAKGDQLINHLDNSLEIAFRYIDRHLNEPFNPFDAVTLIVYNFICGTIMGQTFNPEDKRLEFLRTRRRLITDTMGNGFLADFYPILGYFKIPRMKKAQILIDDMLEFCTGVLKEHKENYSRDNVKDFTDFLLKAQEESAENGAGMLEDNHLVNTLMDILSAGTETTVNTLYWILLYTAHYQDVQEKIRHEMINNIGSQRLPLPQDKKDLPYLDAVISEIQRLRPAVPLGIPRCTTCDTSVGEFQLPKGTDTIANIWAIHHDPRYWDQPNEFRPERFLNADGSIGARPKSFMPFSTGRRVCIGQTVAKPEIFVVVGSLIQKYKWSLLNYDVNIFDPADLGFTVYPKPFKLIISKNE